MQRFVVDFCDVKGCQYNRPRCKCAKDGMKVPEDVSTLSFSQDSRICEIQRQINIYKTEQLLEEN